MNTKRIIALLVCAVMLLSMIPVMAISTSAANDGIWTTYRFAGEYPQPDDDPEEEQIYKPEAGYEYNSEGFMVRPADYKDTTPSMTVITKEKQNIKDGIYLQFRIDDYSYDGGTGADQWICLSLTTEGKVAPGSSVFGGGWLSLIRGTGNGSMNTLAHLTDPKTEDFAGTFLAQGAANSGTAPMDDDGREIYTFEVTWNGSAYDIKINGIVQNNNEAATALLEKLDANGEFYVGINMQAGVKNGTAAITILKYGTSEADATTPVGDDEKDPEENIMEIAPIADPTTVEANKPCMLWTPETYNIKNGNNCTFTALGDNTWRVNASETAVFFNFNPKRSWSWDAVDFPVFGIMFKNIWVDGGTLWYAAGDVTGAQNDCQLPFSVYDGEFYGEDEEYVFVPVDLSELWEGRINTIRLDLAIADEANREFDICFAGMFRSEDEAYAYAEQYLKDTTDVDPDATKEETTPEETEAPTEAPDQGDATDAPSDETTAAAGDATQGGDATEAPEDKGCGGIIGFGAVAVLAAAAAAVVLKKKD